jgi:YHS domain-containing protein
MKSLHLPLILFSAAALPAVAQDWALGGYDPVSYFQTPNPQAGRSEIATMWKGEIWHFSSEENRNRFEADPRSFSPAFGGLCPVALSEGRRKLGDPRHFVMIGKKLYLLSSGAAEARLLAAPIKILGQAQAAWKGQ